MARIPDQEIERLKAEVSVQRLAEARGIELRRHGADLIGRCPFHDDKTPSLVVTPSKNLWHCLGACQAGGTVIDWVMRAEKVSFRHAVELLRADLPLGGPVRTGKASTVRHLPAPVATDADDRGALAQVVDYYHATLKQSPEALAYLESRGLRSTEMIERFKLGYANRTLGLRLPIRSTKLGGELRGRLDRLGVIRDSGHEHLNGSLVIPIFDEDGAVVGMYGRKIRNDLRAGTPPHLYLPGPHRGVWNYPALAASKTVIVCEALFDALTFWSAGLRNVTTAYGVEGFTDEMVEAFKRHRVASAFIAFDRDEAGDRGAEKVAARLVEVGVTCYRVQFPKGMDANEYARKVQPPGKSLDLVVRSAVFMANGKGIEAPALAAIDQTAEATPVEILPLAAPDPVSPPATAAMPASPGTPDIPCEVTPEEVRFVFGDRRYRVRGLARNTAYDALKVNLLCARGEAFHVDTLDVYAARQRAIYVKQAAAELGVEEDVVKGDLGRVLLKLEALQDAQIKEALLPKETAVALTDAERAAALALLRAPDLLDRILGDFRLCGVVGEETNKLVGYLAAVSRKLEDPLAVIIQSSSAAGKSSLMDAILAFMPEEDRVKYAAMTGQSLFYMGETNLKNKILAIVEEEGAARASYALKILQSEGELTIASTGKDPETGKLVTHEYRVEGPVMIFLTTTAIEIDEELLNRCVVLSVDEERGQTQAIHRMQRERQTIEGLLAREDRRAVLKVHQDAQRLLRPLLVANPYARQLTFMDDRTRTRRDHTKYLALIRTIALLHQHQRPVRTVTHRGQTLSYVDVTVDDIAVANRLAHQVLGRSLDELPPQTRRLLGLVDAWVRAECQRRAIARKDFRFSRREVRAATGWAATQTRIHLDRLCEMEYVGVHRGGNGTSFLYELCWDGQVETDESGPHLAGLLDVEALRAAGDAGAGTTPTWRGSQGDLAGGWRAENGGVAAGWRGGKSRESLGDSREELTNGDERSQNARIRPDDSRTSYVVEAAAAGAR